MTSWRRIKSYRYIIIWYYNIFKYIYIYKYYTVLYKLPGFYNAYGTGGSTMKKKHSRTLRVYTQGGGILEPSNLRVWKNHVPNHQPVFEYQSVRTHGIDFNCANIWLYPKALGSRRKKWWKSGGFHAFFSWVNHHFSWENHGKIHHFSWENQVFLWWFHNGM